MTKMKIHYSPTMSCAMSLVQLLTQPTGTKRRAFDQPYTRRHSLPAFPPFCASEFIELCSNRSRHYMLNHSVVAMDTSKPIPRCLPPCALNHASIASDSDLKPHIQDMRALNTTAVSVGVAQTPNRFKLSQRPPQVPLISYTFCAQMS